MPNHASLGESLLQDVRFGLRMLRRQPGFTLTAVVALALAIGPNTVIFSLADAVLWRPLPYSSPEGLVAVAEQRPREGRALGHVAPADFYDWREQARSFEQLAAYLERAALAVTAGFLEALRASPVRGRSFLREEEQPGRARSVILSDGLWRRRCGRWPT